jgi:hypothetical protein
VSLLCCIDGSVSCFGKVWCAREVVLQTQKIKTENTPGYCTTDLAFTLEIKVKL